MKGGERDSKRRGEDRKKGGHAWTAAPSAAGGGGSSPGRVGSGWATADEVAAVSWMKLDGRRRLSASGRRGSPSSLLCRTRPELVIGVGVVERVVAAVDGSVAIGVDTPEVGVGEFLACAESARRARRRGSRERDGDAPCRPLSV